MAQSKDLALPVSPRVAQLLNAAAKRYQDGDLAQAFTLFEDALALDATSIDALMGLSIIAARQEAPAQALSFVERALRLQPRSGRASNQLGAVLRGLGRLENARDAFRRACLAEPDNADFHFNAGSLALQQADYGRAHRHLARAVGLRTEDPEALQALGLTKALQGEIAHGQQLIEAALRLNAAAADAWNDLGTVLIMARNWSEAESAFRRSVHLDPERIEPWYNLVSLLGRVGDSEGALAAQRHLVELSDTPGARWHLVDRLALAGRIDEARRMLDQEPAETARRPGTLWRRLVYGLSPIYRDHDALIEARGTFDQRLREIEEEQASRPTPPGSWAEGFEAGFPFFLAAQGEGDRGYNERIGHLVMQGLPPDPGARKRKKIAPRRRLRVSFIGGTFGRHTVWKLIARGWAERLDADRFELLGYHLGGLWDGETEKGAALFSRFESRERSLAAWAEQIEQDRPNAVIFPELGMDPKSWQIAKLQLAPVQCVAWGHPVTSGLGSMTHFLSGASMEPADADAHYSESLVRLPNLGIYYSPDYFTDLGSYAAERSWAERMVGARDRMFYWSCQALHKYQPRHDDLFPLIAEAVPRALFGFIVPEVHRAIFGQRMADAFHARGLRYEDHCLFLPTLNGRQFAAVSSLADVFLDTLEWSGGNTTLENLHFDTPIVTIAGQFMRGRHAAGILSAAGLSEWLCATKQDYVRRAVSLADPGKRTAARQVLRIAKTRVFNDQSAIDALQDFLIASCGAS